MTDELTQIAGERREKARKLALAEGPNKFNERVHTTLEYREDGVKKIRAYQMKTGVPTREEMDKHFFANQE